MLTRILVPTDFSEASDAALEYARALADKFGSSLHLVHVVEPSAPAGIASGELFIGDSAGLYDLLIKEAQAKLATRVLPADRASRHATTEVVTGRAADAISTLASDLGADMIVMGTHGRTGMAHLIMGSVAEHVVRRAPCPVLTVRQALERSGFQRQAEFLDPVAHLIPINP